MKYLFHPLTFSLCVFLELKWVSCKQHIWILFLHPFSHSIFFNWNIKSVYIWSNYRSCVFAALLLIDWGLFFAVLFCSFPLFCSSPVIWRLSLVSRASWVAQLVKNQPAMQETLVCPGLGRSAREGLGYPLQHSWASLVAQLVKNPPVMQQTWVRSLGWEDPLEKGKATHSSSLAWRIPWTV